MRHVTDETMTNVIKRKHPKKGKEKETRGKHQSQGKQVTQTSWVARRKGFNTM